MLLLPLGPKNASVSSMRKKNLSVGSQPIPDAQLWLQVCLTWASVGWEKEKKKKKNESLLIWKVTIETQTFDYWSDGRMCVGLMIGVWK